MVARASGQDQRCGRDEQPRRMKFHGRGTDQQNKCSSHAAVQDLNEQRSKNSGSAPVHDQHNENVILDSAFRQDRSATMSGRRLMTTLCAIMGALPIA
jgi:hypothetical protein